MALSATPGCCLEYPGEGLPPWRQGSLLPPSPSINVDSKATDREQVLLPFPGDPLKSIDCDAASRSVGVHGVM